MWPYDSGVYSGTYICQPCDTIQGMEAPSEVVDYDEEWPAFFESIRGRIAPALEDLGALVEHVGSTAVPGLAAKQVVDIDVVVRDLRDIKAASQRLEELGYVARAPRASNQTPIMRVPALRTPIRGVPRAHSC